MTPFDRYLPVITGIVLTLLVGSPAPVLAQESSVAMIGKQPITIKELDARTSAKLDAQQNEYDSQLRQMRLGHARARQTYQEKELNTLVDERVLALEAAARKTTPDSLKAAVKAPTITDAQIHTFFDTQQSQIGQPYDTIAPKIKEYLQNRSNQAAQRSYLDSLRRKYDAVITLEPLREHVATTGPRRGPNDAPVTIIEFSDFQCPFCGRYELTLVEILKKYPTQVQLVYRQLPLPSLHPQAQKAAEAAVCAQDQAKFWEMHDLLFSEQSSLGVDALKDKAKRLGLDTKTFDDCLDSGKSRETVHFDQEAAEELGIEGTPASFVNGRFVNGAVSASELSAVIDDELRRAAPMAHR